MFVFAVQQCSFCFYPFQNSVCFVASGDNFQLASLKATKERKPIQTQATKSGFVGRATIGAGRHYQAHCTARILLCVVSLLSEFREFAPSLSDMKVSLNDEFWAVCELSLPTLAAMLDLQFNQFRRKNLSKPSPLLQPITYYHKTTQTFNEWASNWTIQGR